MAQIEERLNAGDVEGARRSAVTLASYCFYLLSGLDAFR